MRRFGSSLADNMRPESDASVGDPGATACLLTSGGDNRILVREDAANRYGCTPWPDPDLFGLGSATASTISEAGFAAADHVRRRALQGADTPADAYSREMDRVRAELLDLCRLSDVPGVDVVFGASGSDLHLYGTLLVDGAGPSPLLAVTVQSEETGRGVPKALGGRHFGDRAALGGAVTKGSRLTGAGMVEVAAVPVRDRDGQPREAEAVDSDIESLVAGAVKKGRQVLLTVTDTTKTGLTAPTPACAFVGAHLEAWGIAPERITELTWWETHRVPGTGLTVTAAPSQHFSGRGLKDRNQTLWSSLVLAGERHRVFFSGDTGLTTEYEVIRDRLGPFDLVMLEVGAFHPSWGDIHLGPENALQAHRMLGGGVLLPVHWGTFSLSTHAWDQPVETLLAQADPAHAHLLLPRLGEPVEPGERRPASPWWRQAHAGKAAATGAPPAPPIGEGDDTGLPWPLD